MKRVVYFVLLAGILLAWSPTPASAADDPTIGKPLPPIPLSINEILAWIDRAHPLLKGAGTEKLAARGKMLKALGAFEPTLINDTEIERFIPSNGCRKPAPSASTIPLSKPVTPGDSGEAPVSVRLSMARLEFPTLASITATTKVLLGGFFPLLRGLMVNPENAELQRSELADPRAEVKISQTRQDLFLAAATQFWDWVAMVKLADVQRRALTVADDRYKQVEGRAKAGAVAPLDVVEANQEVQRRREVAIAAQRAVEQEQYKLSMFLWENHAPTIPKLERAPDFPPLAIVPSAETVRADKVQAKMDRPEIREIDIEAKVNNIDLELAKNNLLPSLDAEAAPARNPEKFVLGLGYRFGVELKIPILQRRSRGEVLEAQAQADRLVLVQKYREQQVTVDVDNALSAIERAKERVAAAADSLRMAKTLEDGERFRFSMGATSVLFVNLRERNSVDSEIQLVRAKADYQKALAFYQWARGTWAKAVPTAVPVNYRIGANVSK